MLLTYIARTALSPPVHREGQIGYSPKRTVITINPRNEMLHWRGIMARNSHVSHYPPTLGQYKKAKHEKGGGWGGAAPLSP